MKKLKNNLRNKVENLKLFFKAKLTTYKIRAIILTQICSQRIRDNSRLREFLEKTSLNWTRAMSKPDNATFFYNIIMPFYLLALGIPYVKKFFRFWSSYISMEIWYILLDLISTAKAIILFPWKIIKAIKKVLYTPWNMKKIVRALKLPISIRLYRLIKKYIWMPIWQRIDYDWFCYALSLYLVNYNYHNIPNEERWFSYPHQTASWDYNWLYWLH